MPSQPVRLYQSEYCGIGNAKQQQEQQQSPTLFDVQ